MSQRRKFIELYFEQSLAIAELCRQFGISRPTAYKWIKRYQNEGDDGLINRSRQPHRQANKTPTEKEFEIIQVRRKYKTWGPKKISAYLKKHSSDFNWPSTTTIGNILTRNGLIIPRKYRQRLATTSDPLSHCEQCNDIWCLDFKGWFITLDRIKCEPFTVMDAHSRYLINCIDLDVNNIEHVWAVLDRAFREYGLPRYIRTDNGSQFASRGPGRLSNLSVRLIKAGVTPEWIDPGQPQQNGRHERMHLTLKNEGTFPYELTIEEQKMKFLEFLEYYNFDRPHEALEQKCPGEIYHPSTRQYHGRLSSPEYSSEYEVRKVRSCGKISLKGKDIHIGRALDGEPVGLIENDAGNMRVFYGSIFLGIIADGELVFERLNVR